MKRKAFKRHRKRVRRFAKPWMHVLGLGWYENIEFLWYDREKEFRKASQASPNAVMKVWADWRYMSATVAVNLPAVARLDTDAVPDDWKAEAESA